MADIGFGAKFHRGSGSPLAYASVGEVIDLKLPELTRDTKETTHFESPNGWREFIGALRDAGEFGVTIQFDAVADLAAFIADFKNKNAVPYRIIFPNNDHWDISGLVTKVGTIVPMEDRMTCEIGIKVSGEPAFIVV